MSMQLIPAFPLAAKGSAQVDYIVQTPPPPNVLGLGRLRLSWIGLLGVFHHEEQILIFADIMVTNKNTSYQIGNDS